MGYVSRSYERVNPTYVMLELNEWPNLTPEIFETCKRWQAYCANWQESVENWELED